MKIYNLTQQALIAQNSNYANSFLKRLCGLLNRSSLSDGEALIITHCQQIHMFFMRFAIDVIFVDETNKVVGLVKNIKPFQLSPIFIKANYAIELPAGKIDQTKTAKGDYLKID